MASPEFIYLNEQAVRVTGWKPVDANRAVEFVVIVQGEGERDRLLDIFSHEPVMVRVGNGSAIPMDVRSLESQATSDGPRATYRLQVSLWPEGSVPAPRREDAHPEDSIEAKLDQIIMLLTEIRDGIRRGT